MAMPWNLYREVGHMDAHSEATKKDEISLGDQTVEKIDQERLEHCEQKHCLGACTCISKFLVSSWVVRSFKVFFLTFIVFCSLKVRAWVLGRVRPWILEIA